MPASASIRTASLVLQSSAPAECRRSIRRHFTTALERRSRYASSNKRAASTFVVFRVCNLTIHAQGQRQHLQQQQILRSLSNATDGKEGNKAISSFPSSSSSASSPAVTSNPGPPESSAHDLRLDPTIVRSPALKQNSDSPNGQPSTSFPSPTSSSSSSSSSSTSSSSSPARSILRSLFTTASVFVVFVSAGFIMAAAPVAETVNAVVNTPTDAETLTLFEPHSPAAAEINEYIVNHPLAQQLRAEGKWTESRPYFKVPPNLRANNLTAGPLFGEGRIEVPSLNFADPDSPLPSFVQLLYLGPALCGHPGIVHGGLLATLLDEGLARTCFPALPNKVGVTASLKLDYRLPCPGPGYVVLRAQTTKVEGRKVWVAGWIEELKSPEKFEEALAAGAEAPAPAKYVDAEALFIEPKHAKNMQRLYGAAAS